MKLIDKLLDIFSDLDDFFKYVIIIGLFGVVGFIGSNIFGIINNYQNRDKAAIEAGLVQKVDEKSGQIIWVKSESH